MSFFFAPPQARSFAGWTTIILASLCLGAAPRLAWGVPCGTWNEVVTAVPAPNHESMAFYITWPAGPQACDGWSIDHYEIHRTGDPDNTDFSSRHYYDAANYVAQVSPSVHSAVDYVHRSGAWFRYRIYACGDADCSTRYYDDGSNAGELADGRVDSDITEVETEDVDGADFGGVCSGSTCTYHQLDHSASDQCVDGGPDDIGYADGAWTGSEWGWTVEMDGGTPYSCPVSEIDDGHDNTGVPLPYGEIRVYYKDTVTGDFRLRVWTGTDWAEWYNGTSLTIESPVEFFWDGMASGGPDDQCIDNLAVILYSRGGTIHEGAFFTVLDSDKCSGEWGASHGLDEVSDGSSANDTSENSLVFAAHTN